MKQKSLHDVAASTLAGAGLALALALAIAVPVAQGQQPVEKRQPPAAAGEKVEQPDPAGQAAENEKQLEERAVTRSGDVDEPHEAAFGFHAELGAPRLGIGIRDVTSEDVANEQLTGQVGVMVTEVEDDSAAAKGGLQKGDVIVSFDGERVRSMRQLSRLVRETPAERQVAVDVTRDGRRQSLAGHAGARRDVLEPEAREPPEPCGQGKG
ncbi:MAG: S1C family serine protease [Vicinamibacteraceae bacterium]